MKKVIFLFVLMVSANTAFAEGLDAKRMYVGGGLGFKSLPNVGSSRGFQFFGGYRFNAKINDDISSALEIGYMDSGKFEQLAFSPKAEAVKGVWVSMLESVPVSNKTDVLVRLGYDFGDDDGLLLGTGFQYKFDTKVALRMEYVTREHVNGLQANFLVKF